MGDKMARHVEPFTTPSLDGMAEMQGAPIQGNGDDQGEGCAPVMLVLGGAVADFPLTTSPATRSSARGGLRSC